MLAVLALVTRAQLDTHGLIVWFEPENAEKPTRPPLPILGVLAIVTRAQFHTHRLIIWFEPENAEKLMMTLHFFLLCCQCPRLFYPRPLSGFFVLFTMASHRGVMVDY
jgi:hypothetical protein